MKRLRVLQILNFWRLIPAYMYGLYRSLFPYLLQQLSIKKGFLYRKQRTLWINNLVFRVKKNYRTYAIVTIMMLCSVSALNAGLAFKQRYDAIHRELRSCFYQKAFRKWLHLLK